ncbi:hydroxyacid dehydrogenase [Microbacterium gilvum]
MRPAALADDLFAHERARLEGLVDLHPDARERFDEADGRLAETEILLAGWGCPRLDAEVLARMPRLRAVLFAGGAAAAVLDTRIAAERGIVFTNAGEGNAQAVAEYTLGVILLAGKRAAFAERLYRERRAHVDREVELRDTGNYRRVVGLIGASRIGRRVAELLRPTDLDVIVYDPYASGADVAALGARRCGLDELLALSDIVSIHAPATAETHEMIGARELALLRDGATLINTARGTLLDHEALRPHVRTGRIDAVLDVTVPEPLPADDELWDLPNVSLTPHIAGATGSELHRLGRDVVDELERFVHGRAFAYREAVPA